MRTFGVAALLLFAGLTGRAADPLSGSATALFAAKSLTATCTVQRSGEAPVVYDVRLEKPKKLRIDSPGQLIVADGASITTYDKSEKSYDKRPESDAELQGVFSAADMALFGAFFDSGFNARYSSINLAGKKELRGVSYDVVTAAVSGKSFTFYVDPSDKIAKIVQVASDVEGQGKMLVQTKDLRMDTPASESDFAFTPPAGAKNLSADAPLKLPREQMPDIEAYKVLPEVALNGCAPSSSADGLAWLSMNGLDALAPEGGTVDDRAVSIAHELVKYYKTDNTVGSLWDNMFPGLVAFLRDRGYVRSKLSLYYWFPNPKWPVEQAGQTIPDLDAIKRACTRNSFVMLAQGWFSNPDAKGLCARVNWHWATVVDADPASDTVTLHDPDHEFNKEGKPLRLKYTKLPANTNILLGGKLGGVGTTDEPGAGIPILENYPNVKPGQFAAVEAVLIVKVAK